MSTVGVDELQTLFLFEHLPTDQLSWLSARTARRTFDAGSTVFREGEPAAHLYVLLDGALRLSRLLQGEDVVITETSHRGAYAGATRAYIAEQDPLYAVSMVATAPSSFVCLTAADFAEFMNTYAPMAVHLLDGLYIGIRNGEATVRQREHLARLGTLSANLAHELNNPAAAAVRATGQLRERVAGMRHKLAMLAGGEVAPETIRHLVACQEVAVEKAAKKRGTLTSVEEADAEDALLDRLDELSVAGAYDLAPVFAAAGLGVEWLDDVVSQRPDAAPAEQDGGLRWLAYTLETEQLMDEIEDATSRISTLVAAVKTYSSMDSSSVQDIDVHVGLDSTVVMLGHKLRGVQVVKEYADDLPRIPAYASELNQVWTNLIDNAADAMGGAGTLTLRTALDGDVVRVEVADDGTGIPPAAQPRVFEAFYTTKAPGLGSGLGLDNAHRIVERRHHGTISFETSPAGTCFAVRLPVSQSLR